MADPASNWVQAIPVVNGQAHLKPRRSAVVLSSAASPVLGPATFTATSSSSVPQATQFSPVLPRLMTTLDDQQRRPSISSPVIATLQSPADVRMRSMSGASTQQSLQFRASIPPVIRSPILAAARSPVSAQQPNPTNFRSSTTALGTKRWSLVSPGASPIIGPSSSPVLGPQSSVFSPLLGPQGSVLTSQAGQQHSPAIVLRRSVVHRPGTSPLMTMLNSEAALPSSRRSSPAMALLVQSPALTKLTPTLPRLRTDSSASAPGKVAQQGSPTPASPKFELVEEDDLFFELPPPVVDLDEEDKAGAPKSDEGSDADSDGGADPADDSLVRSPMGTRLVKASKYSLDRSYSIWFQHAQHAKKRPKSEQQYEEGLQCVGTFDTVEDFWRYWNAIDLEKIPNFCSLSVFKHPIKPMWEDPHNKEGGQWVIRCVDRAQTADCFTNLALSLIGGDFECHEDLCGVVLTMKPKFNSLSLWNCQVEPDLVEPVQDELRELLDLENGKGGLDIEYKEHGGAMVTNAIKLTKPAEAASGRLTSGAFNLGGGMMVGGLTQQTRLAPSWVVAGPACPAASVTSPLMAASSGPALAAASSSASAPTPAAAVARARADSGSAGSGSTLKASAAPFTMGVTTYNGYTAYPASASADWGAQGTVPNGGNQYGQYNGGDYAYYGSGAYASTGAYYSSGQTQQAPKNDAWA